MTYQTISHKALTELQEKNKHNPNAIRTLKCKTVAEARFRHLNYIRDLDVHVIDEPPALLGDDTAPNPSEAALAALGSCIAVGIQAHLVNRGVSFRKIALALEADIDITSVWGTGNTSPDKQAGFLAVRVAANVDADLAQDDVSTLLQEVLRWSPVTGTFVNPVPVTISAQSLQ